ncbi:MAG: two-component system response regulator TorR [Kiloniellales bacterium]|nr:two-component system response regulator TorR [Kiloniellales bacterium]
MAGSAQSAHHVLVVEDDGVTRAKLAGYLEAAGHRVSEAANGHEMRRVLRQDPADLLLLDINLPGEDGLELTRELRSKSEIGIILVTGRTEDIDRIVGLEMGADDYVTKPFNPRELLARAKNLLRRSAGSSRHIATLRRFSGWLFDVRTRRLSSPTGQRVPLTRAEFELLSALTARPGEVFTRPRLLAAISHRSWNPDDRTIDVLIRRLRRKIEENPKVPEIIVTAHGEGYLFSDEIDAVS